MGETKPDMGALQKALDVAIEEKRQADNEERNARHRATDALNRLNEAQRAFDAGVEAIRGEGRKVGGDWRPFIRGGELTPPPPPRED